MVRILFETLGLEDYILEHIQTHYGYNQHTYTKGTLAKIATLSVLYSAHLLILIAGASVRFFKYNEVGLYSLNVPRPTTYWVKLALHAAMGLAIIV